MMGTLKKALSRVQIVLLLLFSFSTLQAANPDNGKKIFEANCTACHKLGGILVGPDLTGVKSRWKDEKKLHAFIHNSQDVVKTDAYAKALFGKFNVIMPPQNLTDDQIADVVEYVNGGGGGQATTPAPTSVAGGGSYAPLPSDSGWVRWLLLAVVVLLGLVFFYTNRLARNLAGQETERPEKPIGKSAVQNINAIMFPVFLITLFVGILYEASIHMKYVMPEAASDTGVEIDRLFNMTAMITGFVFVVVMIVLFAYAYRFRYRDGKKAYFYSHNNKLEFIWTSIPAVVLAGLVLYGFKTWTKATSNPANNPVTIECYAYQFAWEFRYPGPDGKLGRVDFLKIDPATNPFGLDFSDPAAQDDFTTTELHMPVNSDVYLKLRSRDVIHAAYLPHFRAQMYAQPGMDNRIRFRPLYTTAEFRQKINNPNFNYELACNQLCGASHFNMRRLVIVDTKEEFEKWTKTFKPFYESYKSNQKTALK